MYTTDNGLKSVVVISNAGKTVEKLIFHIFLVGVQIVTLENSFPAS